MISQGEDVEVHALRQQGWTISAIPRRLDRDRKTIRAYVNGRRDPGVRKSAVEVDPLDAFDPYLPQRFVDDPQVPAVTVSTKLLPVATAGRTDIHPQDL